MTSSPAESDPARELHEVFKKSAERLVCRDETDRALWRAVAERTDWWTADATLAQYQTRTPRTEAPRHRTVPLPSWCVAGARVRVFPLAVEGVFYANAKRVALDGELVVPEVIGVTGEREGVLRWAPDRGWVVEDDSGRLICAWVWEDPAQIVEPIG